VIPTFSVSLDITPMITAAFSFANNLLPVLGPIAGIGIGFTLCIGLVAWIGSMLSKVFKGRGG
jgi:hypothetical protein